MNVAMLRRIKRTTYPNARYAPAPIPAARTSRVPTNIMLPLKCIHAIFCHPPRGSLFVLREKSLNMLLGMPPLSDVSQGSCASLV